LIFLCDYYTNDEFRRRLLRVLNYGESVHALQRTIYFGSIPAARGRHREELVASSGSLALLTNLTMAWVTHQIQMVADEQGRAGNRIGDDVLRHIGPVHAESVNFEGQFTFPISKFASRLLGADTRASRNKT
jgi:TnpA family transposase